MSINPEVLAIINLVLQLLLFIAVVIAVYLAKKKRLAKHCAIIRIAIPLQVIAIAGVMLPSMGAYLRYGQPGSFFNIEVWTHHILGLVVIVLWIYVNLVMLGVIKMRSRLVIAMRLAFICWLLALIMGVHLYVLLWV